MSKIQLVGATDFSDWAPHKWCVAAHKLCDAHQDENHRYPEQWIYFLWRPSGRAVAYRDPDCIGYVIGDPYDQVLSDIEHEPLYLLQEDECCWPALLELTLTVDDIDEWLEVHVRNLLAQKTQGTKARWRRKYDYGSGSTGE